MLTVALAAVSLALVSTVPAHAAPSYDESNRAAEVEGPPPSGATCVTWGSPTSEFAAGCFEKNGDEWWVGEHELFGEIVYVDWENDLKAPDFSGSYWYTYRTGRCYLQIPSNYGWGLCNKDYYENSSTNFYGLKGSKLRWRVCVAGVACSYWDEVLNDQ